MEGKSYALPTLKSTELKCSTKLLSHNVQHLYLMHGILYPIISSEVTYDAFFQMFVCMFRLTVTIN